MEIKAYDDGWWNGLFWGFAIMFCVCLVLGLLVP